MKKYMVEVFLTTIYNEEGLHEVYECESFEETKDWTGNCIRLEDVNSYKTSKTGKIQRKQFSRGKYITVNKMKHWKEFHVYVWENGTDNIVKKYEG